MSTTMSIHNVTKVTLRREEVEAKETRWTKIAIECDDGFGFQLTLFPSRKDLPTGAWPEIDAGHVMIEVQKND